MLKELLNLKIPLPLCVQNIADTSALLTDSCIRLEQKSSQVFFE